MQEKRGSFKKTERKIRSDKKVRVFPYVPQDDYKKLDRLSRACNTTPHELTVFFINMCLQHPEIINYTQDRHGVEKDDTFRLTPIKCEGVWHI